MDGHRKIVKSAGRVFAVLEYFAEIARPASAVEICTRLDLPASSTSALLGSLVDLGYLHYDPRRRVYHPTIRVGFLGDWIQAGGLDALLLEDLKQQTHQLVVLVRAANSMLANTSKSFVPANPVRFAAARWHL